jgi:hypothetical protein
MKTTRIITVCLTALAGFSILFSASSVGAQEKKITQKDLPPAVLAAFEKTYPKAEIKGVSEEKGEDGKMEYEIESIEGKTARDVAYLADGKVIEIEETCVLPDAVRQALDQKYPKGKIVKAEKITRGSKVEYEAVVAAEGKKSEVVLDPAGKVLKVEKKSEEEEKGEAGKASEEKDEK